MKIFLIKVNNKEVVESIVSSRDFIHDDIYNFEDEITEKDIVFIYFGGDKSQITWEQGLRAVGEVIRKPFDKGYDINKPRYFRIEIKPLYILDHSIPPKISKIHKKFAESLYEVPYVGANHFPTQAIAKIESPCWTV